jgi:hypothetical protein
MARATYKSGEIEPNHKIVEGIKATLEGSHTGRSRTTIRAIEEIDLEEESRTPSINDRISYICELLHCTHEQIGDEIVFTLIRN